LFDEASFGTVGIVRANSCESRLTTVPLLWVNRFDRLTRSQKLSLDY
jgi:hypothetical protein